MKVICIDASGKSDMGCNNPLIEGDVYTASQSPTYGDSYRLAEIPTNEWGFPLSFRKRRFIPLSEINETEFERNYKKELV